MEQTKTRGDITFAQGNDNKIREKLNRKLQFCWNNYEDSNKNEIIQLGSAILMFRVVLRIIENINDCEVNQDMSTNITSKKNSLHLNYFYSIHTRI